MKTVLHHLISRGGNVSFSYAHFLQWTEQQLNSAHMVMKIEILSEGLTLWSQSSSKQHLKKSVSYAKKTQHFTITKINWSTK
jgi:hypothetical protein